MGERRTKRQGTRSFRSALAGCLIATFAIAVSATAAPSASLVKNINPGGAGSNPEGFANLPGTPGAFVFSANDGSHGYEVWRSNGAGTRTRMVRDIRFTSGYPNGFTPYAGKVFYAAHDGYHGTELWSTDGTRAGTKLVKDLIPGTEGSRPGEFTRFDGKLFFSSNDTLWSTDGTKEGTHAVKVLWDNPPEEIRGPSYLRVLGDKLLFSGTDVAHGVELWQSDGTTAGTKVLKDIIPGPGESIPAFLTVAGGKLFFTASDSHGREVWTSNGTAAGTKLVKDIVPNGGSSLPSGYTAFAAKPGTVVFQAIDGMHGYELWKSNGTAAGTKLVRDINPTGGSFPYTSVSLGSKVFFPADDGTHGAELWASDGTSAGTKLVKDIYPGPTSSLSPSVFGEFTTFGGGIVFPAIDATHGAELWGSNGFANGTGLVADVRPGVGDSRPIVLGLTNPGTVYFAANDGPHGRELWKAFP